MDRFYRGFVAGVVGGMAMNIWSYISVDLLRFSSFHFLDWAAVMTFGSPPDNFMESFMSFIVHLFWTGFLGIIMAYLVTLTTSRRFLLKGIIIGIILFFILNAMPVLFQTPYLHDITSETAASNGVGSIIWGLGTAYTLQFLDTTKINT